MKEIRKGVLVGVLSSLFILFIFLFDNQWANYANANLHRAQKPFFRILNRSLYDLFFNWRGSSRSFMEQEAKYTKQHPEKTILIFYIDKLTLLYAKDHFNETFPWPRSRYASALLDLKAAGARSIGLDLLFPDFLPGDLHGEPAMFKALRTTHAVIASRFVYAKNTIQNLEPPIFSKVGEVQYGFVDVFSDEDRVVRQCILQLPTRFSNNPWSFEAMLLRQTYGKPLKIEANQLLVGDQKLPVQMGTLMERKSNAKIGAFSSSEIEPVHPALLDVNYTIPNNFVHYPLYSLWNEDRQKRLLEARGKIVLIGANAAEGIEIFGNDLFATPVGLMNGVELHAHVLRTVLENRPILNFPNNPIVNVLIILGIGVLYGAGLPLFKGWSRFFFGCLILIGEVGLAYFLFREFSVRILLSYFGIAAAFDFGSVSYYFYVRTKKEVDSVRHLFEGYLSPKVVHTLLEDENRDKIRKQLAGDKQTTTILYSDIRGFTQISEMLRPEEVVALLNEYFPPMTSIVYDLGGYLDKFIGDAVMAVFSAPFPQEGDPWRAVQAAVEMQKALARLGGEWEKQGRPKFQIGIGINTGEVILGNVGSEHKKDYTVIGDAVNIAARLCGIATGGQILISEATYQLVKDKIQVTSLGPITVKGKKVPVETYAVHLIGDTPQ